LRDYSPRSASATAPSSAPGATTAASGRSNYRPPSATRSLALIKNRRLCGPPVLTEEESGI